MFNPYEVNGARPGSIPGLTLVLLALTLGISGQALAASPTSGSSVLLFSSKGYPYLTASAIEGGVLFEVVDAKDSVVESLELKGCDLAKLKDAVAKGESGCIPEELAKKHSLKEFPQFSPLCSDGTALISVHRDKSGFKVDLELASWKTTLLQGAGKKGFGVRLDTGWSRDCSIVVVSHLGKESVGTKSATLKKGERKKFSRQALTSFWSARAAWLLKQGDYDPALSSARAAADLAESASDLKALTLILAEMGIQKEAMNLLEKLKKKSQADYDSIRNLPLIREAWLSTLDLASADWTFSAPKGFEGTTTWVKIKDKNGNNIAIFKPTSGNTYHRGEVFTYQMAKILGIEELYPVSVLYNMDKAGCKKLVATLEGVTYKGPKEQNRKRVIAACKAGKLEGAVKEWVKGFIYFNGIGKAEKLKKHAVAKLLTRDGNRPGKSPFKVTVKTKLYKPDNCKQATYLGTIDQDLLARDLSDLMIMDVLNGNEDRFPGANIEFKSLGKVSEPKTCTFDFGPSRLFSLDNGSTFKGSAKRAYGDLSKTIKVTRFNRRTWRRLSTMQEFIAGKRPCPAYLRRVGIKTVDDLKVYLKLDKGDSHKNRKNPFKLFSTNLNLVVKYMKTYVADKYAWF